MLHTFNWGRKRLVPNPALRAQFSYFVFTVRFEISAFLYQRKLHWQSLFISSIRLISNYFVLFSIIYLNFMLKFQCNNKILMSVAYISAR